MLKSHLNKLGIISALAFSACSQSETSTDYCQKFDADQYLEFEIAPFEALKTGELISSGGNAVSPSCMKSRVCELNQWTHDNYNQGYLFEINDYGTLLLQKTFPKEIEAVTASRAKTSHFKLESFCKKFDLGASQNKELSKNQK